MEFRLREGENHIKLGQLLKACDLVSSGAEAKEIINKGLVKVNGDICDMRGKKICGGDIVEYEDKEVHIII